MSPSPNRARIVCTPLAGAQAPGLLMGLPATLEPLALLRRDSFYVADGVLVRVRASGLLAHYVTGSLRSIDQRKAQASLDAMLRRLAHGDIAAPDADKEDVDEKAD